MTRSDSAQHRAPTVLIALMVVLMFLSFGRLFIGETVGWPTGEHASLFLEFRLMRTLAALAVGAALATSGVALQALLRNPLAEPYILGLSTGAALGVTVQLSLSYALSQSIGPTHLGALSGALVSMAIVYVAGRRHGIVDPLGLLLVGVVLSTLNGALIMLVRYLTQGEAGLNDQLVRWMMGYLDESVSRGAIAVVAIMTVAGVAVLASCGRAMDVASFSDAEAQSLGVNLRRLRMLLFFVSSLLAAGAVVLAGPIAFVGLIAPHVGRMLLGPAHVTLVLGSAAIGAILIVCADGAIVAMDFGQGRMPMGILTALIGGPTFLYMLRSQLGRGIE